MKVINVADVAEQSADDNPLFTGGHVSRQPIVTPDMGAYFNMSVVNFDSGAKNKFHTHTSDQGAGGHGGHRHRRHGERGAQRVRRRNHPRPRR